MSFFQNVINDIIFILEHKTTSQSKYIEILKLDQNGNQLEKIVRNLDSAYSLSSALYLNNKFFIVGSAYENGLFLVVDSLVNTLYSKINIYGDIDWFKIFSENILTAKFLSNNSILLGGKKISNNCFTDGYLINLDLNGNENWQITLKS